MVDGHEFRCALLQAIITYNAATGTKLWVKRYNGPASFDNNAVDAIVCQPNTIE